MIHLCGVLWEYICNADTAAADGAPGSEEGEVLIHLSGVMREWICNAVDAADDSVLGGWRKPKF